MSSGTAGQRRGIVVIQTTWMSLILRLSVSADDVTAEWQTTHFNFHDIGENVLKLDVLGHDDPTMIRKLQDLSGIDLIKFLWMTKA